MCKATEKKMGVSTKRILKFADPLVASTFEIPRLENSEIDNLFYQEDEVGEMRYFSFMIECGIEEDPIDDRPDVEPVPWLLSQLSKEEQDKLLGKNNEKEEFESKEEYFDLEEQEVKLKSGDDDDGDDDVVDVEQSTPTQTKQPRRKPPRRMRSMDHMVQKFNDNTAKTDESDDEGRRPPPRRARPAPNARKAPKRSPSMDMMLAKFETKNNNGGGADPSAIPSAFSISVSNHDQSKPTRRSGSSRRATPSRGKLVCTRSGSDLSDMKDTLRKNRRQRQGQGEEADDKTHNDEEEASKTKAPTSPRKPFREVRGKLKLAATKSGSLHHMRATLNRNRASGSSSPPKRTDGRRGSGVFHGLSNNNNNNSKPHGDINNQITSRRPSTKINVEDPTRDSDEDTVDSDEERSISASSDDVSIESD